MDQPSVVVKADHAPRAFGDSDEVEGVLALDGVERDPMHGGDFRRIRRYSAVGRCPHHDRRDQIARPGRIVVEQAEHRVERQFEAKLFVQFAQRGLNRRLAGVAPPARQGPLRAMGTQAGRATCQEKRRPFTVVSFDKRDRHRRALQRGRGIARLCARERRAEPSDIPPGGIVEWTGHPA
jgi:hypothetical protein